MQGYLRRKTRPQAQQEIPFQQRSFGGGQNSDLVPTKIGAAEVALSVNTVHTNSDIQGGWGRKLLSPELWPGSGTLHSVAQHPTTGRWLVHRGTGLWLSTGRDGSDWTEVTAIGPDGSLTATGSFTDGSVTISGAVGGFISDMVLAGVTPGQTVYIQAEADAGLFIVRVYSDVGMTTLIASGSIPDATVLPAPVTLTQSGGSGVSGTVSMDANPTGSVRTGSGVVAEYEITFSLRGLTLENTDDYTLYWRVTSAGSTATLILYKDAALTQSVATSGAFASNSPPAPLLITPLNSSGISGTCEWPGVTTSGNTIVGEPVVFPASIYAINENSTISFFRESGFIVHVRGASPRTVYVEQNTNQYLFLSEVNGYGLDKIAGAGSGAYQYRYLYTYSRIVDPDTYEPDFAANRDSGILQFEGPSNKAETAETDYAVMLDADPVSVSDPIAFPLVDETDGAPIGLNAAAYITHISIYRTLDVGVNGVGLNGAANNTEQYIWVADVPIYSTTYSDTADDALLKNRLVGASQEQDNLALRSRLYTEMPKGIGAVGPDFMFTSAPEGNAAAYCDIAANPRLIGYHFAGSQRHLVNDPISNIYRTNSLFVVTCPSSTYTCIPEVQQETGIAGLIPILTLLNFEPASNTLGVKYGQGLFPVDENSFVSLLSDGTVRVFSGNSWGEPLDAENVHGITELAIPGAVFSFLRKTLLVWLRTEPEEDPICLRYGVGGPNGNRWTTIERSTFTNPPPWCGAMIVEDDDAMLRMAVFDQDDEAVFAVEDAPPLRQYVDDVVDIGPTVVGLYFGSPALTGSTPRTRYYCAAIYLGSGNYAFYAYGSAAARTGGEPGDVLFEGDVTFNGAVESYVLVQANASGISGTIDILSTFPFAASEDVNFDIVTSGMAIVAGTAEISPIIRLRELVGQQENFLCFHQESHVAVRPRYGQSALPSGLLFTVRGYEAGVLNDGATTVAAPVDFDIQFFARLQGNQIQIEYQANKSGWRITSFDTQYQSQDMQAGSGPWNSIEAEYQAALAADLVSWLYGSTGLIDRASATNAPYVGTAPTLIEGPSGTGAGQRVATPITRAYAASLTDYTLMFWALAPTIGTAPATGSISYLTAALFAMFDSTTSIIASGTSAAVSPSVILGNGWQHFAITRTGTTLRIYQNGSLIATTTVSGAAVVVTGQEIGCAEGSQDIDDLRLYSAALSAEVIAYYYNDVDLNEGKKVLP